MDSDTSGLINGRFEGRSAFVQLLRDAIGLAAREGWHEMIWSDASFEDWPLNERAVIDTLHAWAKSGRRLTLLATRFDGLVSHAPRFVAWRRTWSHIVEARQCRHDNALDFPSAIWSPHWAMRRLDPVRCAGVAGVEAQLRVNLHELLNEKIRLSSAGFPASTLGL
jgi:hypothetical protein